MSVGKEYTDKSILVNDIVSSSSVGHVVHNVAMGQAFI